MIGGVRFPEMENNPVADKGTAHHCVAFLYDGLVVNVRARSPQIDALDVAARVKVRKLAVLGDGFDLFLQKTVESERFGGTNELRIVFRYLTLTEDARDDRSEMLRFDLVGF